MTARKPWWTWKWLWLAVAMPPALCGLAITASIVVGAMGGARASVARIDPRCSNIHDPATLDTVRATSWSSLASGAVEGPVGVPVYVTRVFDPQPDGQLEIVASEGGASFAMIAPASSVDTRLAQGGNATVIAFGPPVRAGDGPTAPVVVCGVVPR